MQGYLPIQPIGLTGGLLALAYALNELLEGFHGFGVLYVCEVDFTLSGCEAVRTQVGTSRICVETYWKVA